MSFHCLRRSSARNENAPLRVPIQIVCAAMRKPLLLSAMTKDEAEARNPTQGAGSTLFQLNTTHSNDPFHRNVSRNRRRRGRNQKGESNLSLCSRFHTYCSSNWSFDESSPFDHVPRRRRLFVRFFRDDGSRDSASSQARHDFPVDRGWQAVLDSWR